MTYTTTCVEVAAGSHSAEAATLIDRVCARPSRSRSSRECNITVTADASRGQTKEASHEFCRSDQLMLPQLCQFLRSSSSFGVLVLVSFRSHCFDCVWCNRSIALSGTARD